MCFLCIYIGHVLSAVDLLWELLPVCPEITHRSAYYLFAELDSSPSLLINIDDLGLGQTFFAFFYCSAA